MDSNGVPPGVAKMPGSGPTWLTVYASLPEVQRREHLVASYVKPGSHGPCAGTRPAQPFILVVRVASPRCQNFSIPVRRVSNPVFAFLRYAAPASIQQYYRLAWP
jgi:hypothetical protein